jgi:hypothetical protein
MHASRNTLEFMASLFLRRAVVETTKKHSYSAGYQRGHVYDRMESRCTTKKSD